MTECRGATLKSNIALALAIVSIIWSTWYLPGLVRVLNKLSAQVEKQDARTPGRNQ